jgi:class 3 adenylate cyclase
MAQDWSAFTLRFHDAAAESAFARDQADRSRLPARWATAVLGVILVLSTITVARLFPNLPDLHRAALPSFAVLTAAFISTWLDAYERHHQAALAATCVGASMAVLNLVMFYPQERLLASGFFIPAIHCLMIYTLFGLRFPIAVALGWTMTAAFTLVVRDYHGLTGADLARQFAAVAYANMMGMLIGWQLEAATRRGFLGRREAERERARSDALLLNILPLQIAERLKASPGVIAEAHASVTVLFADIVGFTNWCARRPPEEVVKLLDQVFTVFDAVAQRHGLEKIKTIGDCYMAVAGLPTARDDHARAALDMAREMLSEAQGIAVSTGEPLELRVGLSSGPVVAGVIGRSKFIFDLWGDTVNTASRMESHGRPGRIQCCEETARMLPGVDLEARDGVEVRGKGAMRVFLVGAA